MTVRFAGDDGRTAVFSTSGLALPGWHAAVGAAFGQRVGPTGTRRTLASATATWTLMARFLRFLSGLTGPRHPGRPGRRRLGPGSDRGWGAAAGRMAGRCRAAIS
jgi:hypothetical protein